MIPKSGNRFSDKIMRKNRDGLAAAAIGRTPWSGTQTSFGSLPACQNTSIGMPPRGYQ